MPLDLPWWGQLVTFGIMLLVFGGPIWVIFQGVKYYSRKQNGALGIAAVRYAKGEISKAEFEEIKKNIS